MNPLTSSSGEGELSLPDIIVFDSCVLLNLHASGHVEEILASLSCQGLASPYARSEVLWYLAPPDEENESPMRRDITLEPLVEAHLLSIVELTSEEQASFVQLAQQLGDGEAASGALAISRSASVATDDLKARRVFAQLRPPLGTISTATLLRTWEQRSRPDRSAIATALQSIRRGARFSPRAGDDDAVWWEARMQEIASR